MQPQPYHPDYEVPEDGEAEVHVRLRDTLRGISEKTWEDRGHATRSVHAKSHGLLEGRLRVLDGLPPELAQGLFARAADYPVVMRLSTTPGDVLDDSVSTPRGMAVKVIGVEGGPTQDFVLVNGPVFLNKNAKQFLGGLELLAATTDKAHGLKKALSAVLRGAEQAIEAVGGESVALKAVGGHPLTHPLGETYFSQVPILYGPYMAKVCVAPVSPELAALEGARVHVHGKPDALRDAVTEFFAAHGAEWELRVQLCTNIETMPLEDPTVEWPQDQSPYIVVARIVAQPQPAWSAARSRVVDEEMSFSPWHCVPAHRPLGAIMRARKAAYEMSARYRAQRTGVIMREPDHLEPLPS